ncbi:MAG: SRPBCC family protein [Pseudomonadota bacterium]
MRLLKRFITGLLALIVVLAGVAFLLPREVSVARTIQIDAPPEAVFGHVDNLQAFAEWSPWGALDPDMSQSFSGPERGVGNRMEWQSEAANVGSGTQEIVAVKENEAVETALDFGPMGTADAQWLLAAKEGGTEVTWAFQTDMGMNPISRYMGLMMDGWVGADYEKGLANLKARVEGS